ncbi:MAG: hypothetical protein F6K26_52840 [Moorea sp. SIO2I5]|nr:hypothetical protein [Moorena sp. SIO2I5]
MRSFYILNSTFCILTDNLGQKATLREQPSTFNWPTFNSQPTNLQPDNLQPSTVNRPTFKQLVFVLV